MYSCFFAAAAAAALFMNLPGHRIYFILSAALTNGKSALAHIAAFYNTAIWLSLLLILAHDDSDRCIYIYFSYQLPH